MELNKLIIISGPSAVGKTTIANGLTKTELPLEKVVTTTTRSRRPKEVAGVDYHFLTDPEFEELVKNNRLLEWAKFNGHYYGSRWEDVEGIVERGNIPLWVAENQGVVFFKTHYPHAVNIFIMPASIETLRRRLEKRKLPPEELANRLSLAQAEMLNAPAADYQVINVDGKIELIVEETADIIRQHFGLTN